jgi:hypothetical protein
MLSAGLCIAFGMESGRVSYLWVKRLDGYSILC